MTLHGYSNGDLKTRMTFKHKMLHYYRYTFGIPLFLFIRRFFLVLYITRVYWTDIFNFERLFLMSGQLKSQYNSKSL